MPKFLMRLSVLLPVSILLAAALIKNTNGIILYAISTVAAGLVLYAMGFALDKLERIHHNSKIIADASLSYLRQHPLDGEDEDECVVEDEEESIEA